MFSRWPNRIGSLHSIRTIPGNLEIAMVLIRVNKVARADQHVRRLLAGRNAVLPNLQPLALV